MEKKLYIKHVRFTFDEWNVSIQKKKVYQSEKDDMRFALIKIEEVKKPQVWEAFGRKITVADNGYKWLVASSEKEDYIITMYMNDKMEPVIWYIDMCDGQGIDDDGVYYYNDIFLDLLVSTSYDVIELDQDELELAYNTGVITNRQKKLAIETAEKIKHRVSSSSNWIYDFCMNALKDIQNDIINGRAKMCE